MKQTTRLMTLLALALAGVGISPVQAAVINVAPGEVAVNPGNGKCSLIEAIKNSESDSDTSGGDCPAGSGADTIVLASNSTYTLTASYPLSYPYLYTGLPFILHSLTIDGQGATIQRDPSLGIGTACSSSSALLSSFRIFKTASQGWLALKNLTVKYGCIGRDVSSGGGGGIMNNGTLTLDNVTVTGNEAIMTGAGGIQNNGTLNLINSRVTGNTATGAAGGGIVNNGILNITQSIVSGNAADGAGGGIDTNSFVGSGRVTSTVTNTTLSGNSSLGQGGGVSHMHGSFAMTNVTVAENNGAQNLPAATAAGGVYSDSAGSAMALKNVLLAQQVTGNNCYGSFTGNNDLSDDATCPGTLTNTNPLIGPLANNGGPTQTYALLTGSPAIDAGDNAAAAGLTTDQRGAGFARVIGANVDIGAYEYGDTTSIPASVQNAVPNPSGTGTGDGNGDGIPDSQQSNVASLNAAAGGAMGTIATAASSITLSAIHASAPPVGTPTNVTFPYGLFSFTLNNVSPGATQTVTVYVPYNPAINSYLKQNKSGQWVNVATSITQDGNKTKIVFPLTEGGPFDFDSNTTTITDPGGPGILTQNGIPALSEWGMMILAALMALGAFFGLRGQWR